MSYIGAASLAADILGNTHFQQLGKSLWKGASKKLKGSSWFKKAKERFKPFWKKAKSALSFVGRNKKHISNLLAGAGNLASAAGEHLGSQKLHAAGQGLKEAKSAFSMANSGQTVSPLIAAIDGQGPRGIAQAAAARLFQNENSDSKSSIFHKQNLFNHASAKLKAYAGKKRKSSGDGGGGKESNKNMKLVRRIGDSSSSAPRNREIAGGSNLAD